jgi:hypothetical protein
VTVERLGRARDWREASHEVIFGGGVRGTESCGDNSEGLLLEKTFRTTGSSREVDEKLEKLS